MDQDKRKRLSESVWAPIYLTDLATRIIKAVVGALPPEQWITVEVAPASIEVSPWQATSLALIFNEGEGR